MTKTTWFTVKGKIVAFLDGDETMVVRAAEVDGQPVDDGRLYLRWVGNDYTNETNGDGDFTQVGDTVSFTTMAAEQRGYLTSS